MQTAFTAAPVTGADLTVGLSPDSMHVDPTSSVPYYDEAQAAQAAAAAAAQAAAQPQGMSFTTILLLAAGAYLVWYGYENNWKYGGLWNSVSNSVKGVASSVGF